MRLISKDAFLPPFISSACRQPIDVVVVAESSSSVSNQQFDVIKSAITKMIDNNDVSATGVKIGVVTFRFSLFFITLINANYFQDDEDVVPLKEDNGRLMKVHST